MLFHVTITHGQEHCPGRQADNTPDLIGPTDQAEGEGHGNQFLVTPHSVVWGASCILWAEPEHVAYALLEAPSLEAVERYIAALIPSEWATRVLPVFTLPGQLAVVRQILATPAMPAATQPDAVAMPVDAQTTVDTLKGLAVGTADHAGDLAAADAEEPPPAAPRPAEATPPDKRATRQMPQPVLPEEPRAANPEPHAVAPPEQRPRADTSALTRFIPRPTILDALVTDTPAADEPEPEPPCSPLDTSEPTSPSESTTLVLEARIQRPPQVRLAARTGPAAGSVFQVGEDGATLGRLPDNSICLTDGRLSRHHARIDFRDGAYWVTDLGSQNGTLVNDRPLSEAHRLLAGDSIELGTTRLTVMLDPDD